MSKTFSIFPTYINPFHSASNDRISELQERGDDPSQIDRESGFSPIDHAVFSNDTKRLPSLLNQLDATNDSSYRSPKTSKRLNQAFAEMLKSGKIFEALSVIERDVKSSSLTELTAFLDLDLSMNSHTRVLNRQYGIQPIHILASLASPKVLQAALELQPRLLETKDRYGNTPLHYTALREDHHCFALLASRGANTLAKNTDRVTPGAQMVYNIKARDPLSLSRREIQMFVCSWIPTVVEMAYQCGLLNPEDASAIRSFFPQIEFFGAISSFLHDVDSFSSTFRKLLYASSGILLGSIPLINVPIRALATYNMVMHTLIGLNDSHKHFNRRPLQALKVSIVKASNAYDYLTSFFKIVTEIPDKIAEYKTAYMIYGKKDKYIKAVEDHCPNGTLASLQEEFGRLWDRFASVNNHRAKSFYTRERYPFTITEEGERFKIVDKMSCAAEKLKEVFSKEISPGEDGYSPSLHKYIVFANEFPEVYNVATQRDKLHCQYNDFSHREFFELIENYVVSFFNSWSTPTNSKAGGGACSAYKRPGNFDNLTDGQRIEAIGQPTVEQNGVIYDCLNMAKDILKLDEVCDKNKKGKAVYIQKYRDLSKQFHGDKVGNSTESLMQAINAASDIVKKTFKETCTKKTPTKTT